MIKLLRLILRFACNIDPQLVEDVFIYSGKDHGRVSFRTSKLGQLLHGKRCSRVGGCAYGKSYKDLICMQAGIAISHMLDLQLLYWFYNDRRNQMYVMMYAAKLFQGIQQSCC